MKKRMLSLILTVVMLLTMLPTQIEAAGGPPFTISGADITMLNGTYNAGTDYNGKSCYIGNGGSCFVYWINSRWELIYSNQTRYYSTSTSKDPIPPIDGWKLANGSNDANFILSYGPTISISQSTVTINESVGTLDLTITLSELFPYLVSADYTTTNGTANETDYYNSTGVIAINGGETSATLSIPIYGDTTYETDETFSITLSNPSTGTEIGTGSCSVNITNDDPVPSIGFAANEISFNENSGIALLPVKLSNRSYLATSIDYSMTDGTATSGEDYTISSGTINFPAGSKTSNIQIPILNNIIYEGDKTFTVTLSNTVNANQGITNATIKIVEDEPKPIISSLEVSPLDATVRVGNTFKFTEALTGENNPPLTVGWSVSGNTSINTTIDETGLLSVAVDETATSLTITATSTYDETKSATAIVNVLDSKPILDINLNGYINGTWTNQEVTVTASNLAEIGTTLYEYKLNDGEWTEFNGSLSISEEGIHLYKFRATSEVGLVSDIAEKTIKIDKSVPGSATVIKDPLESASGWIWSMPSITITPPVPGISEENTYYQLYSFKTGTSAGVFNITSGMPTITEEGMHNLYVWTEDDAGNICSQEVHFVDVDLSGPTNVAINFEQSPIRYVANFLTFNLFFNNTVNVNLSANDEASGIDYYEYQIVNKGATFDENGVWIEGGSFSIDPEFKGNIYARAVDKAGHISPYITRNCVVDTQAPVLTAEYAYNDVWTNTNPNAYFTITDNGSGIGYIYCIRNSSNFNMDYTFNFFKEITESEYVTHLNFEDGNYEVVTSVRDNSNNVSNTIVLKIKKDTSTPVITSTADTSTLSLSQVVNIGVTPGISGVKKIEVKKDDGGWTDITSSYAGGYTATANGVYTFKLTNQAGSVGLSNVTFTNIDSELPVVIINSNGYESGKWINTGVTINLSNGTANIGTTSFEYKLDDGTWTTFSGSITVATEGIHNYKFRAISEVGQISAESETFIVKIDKGVPGNPTVSANPGHSGIPTSENNINGFNYWFNTVPTITINPPTSGLSGEKTYYTLRTYSSGSYTDVTDIANGMPLLSGNSLHDLSVWTEDEAGNKSPQKTYFADVDTTGPENLNFDISQIPINKIDNFSTYKLFFNEETPVYIMANDLVSRVEHFEYQLISSDDVFDENDPWTLGNFFTVLPEFKGKIYARAFDNAGNVSNIISKAIVIDNSIPTINVTYDYNNIWTKDTEAKITATLSDISGLNNISYKIGDEEAQIVNFTSSEYSDLTENHELTISDLPNGEYDVVINAEDNSGNENLTIVKVKKDTSVLAITSTGDTKTISQSVAVDIDIIPGISGMKKVEVQIGDGKWEDITSTYSIAYIVFANAKYTFKLTNNAGSSVQSSITFNNIDTVAPFVVINSNGYESGKWTNSEVSINVTNTSNNLGRVLFEYKLNDGMWTEFDGSLKVSEEGRHNYTFRAISESQVTSAQVNFTVCIDKKPPTDLSVKFKQNPFKEVANFLTFGVFFNNTVQIDLSATDTGSAVDYIEYQLVDENATFNQNGTWTKGNTVSIDPQFKGFVYARACDMVGNVSAYVSKSFVTDTNIPHINVEYAKVGSWTNDINAKVDATVTDNGAGVAKIMYTVNNGEVQTIDLTTTEYDSLTKQYDLTIDKLPEGDYDVVINAIDNSGNPANSVSVNVKKDTTKPAISLTGDTEWISQSKLILLDISPSISGFKKVEVQKDSGNWQDITMSFVDGYTTNANGVYNFRLTNNAGSTVEKSMTLANIDTAAPVVNVNTNGYTSGTWVNTDVNFTISNTTANLGATKLEYKLANGKWTEFDGTLKVSQDGEHSYVFRAQSAAGILSNETQPYSVKLDKILPKIGSVIYKSTGMNIVVKPYREGFKEYFNKEVKVEVNASDSLSNVAKTEIQFIRQGYKANTSKWMNYANPKNRTKSPNFTGYVGVRVTDNAGNVTNSKYYSMVIDNLAPTISGAVDGKSYYSARVIKFTDNYGQIKSATYNGKPLRQGMRLSAPGKYKIVVSDLSGNIKTLQFTILKSH